MPFQIIRDDITRMNVDAIVNPASPSLLGGGGVDGAIHNAAGPQLREACRRLGGCRVGEVKVTSGFELPCRYIFHTVGPVWKGGLFGEEIALRSCYNNALSMAVQMQCESIAFPLISGGAFAYPVKKALRVATECITAFVLEHDLSVSLVLYGSDSLLEGRKLFPDIQEYIDDHYVGQKEKQYGFRRRQRYSSFSMPAENDILESADAHIAEYGAKEPEDSFFDSSASESALEGFSADSWDSGFAMPTAQPDRPDAAKSEPPENTGSFSAIPAPQAKPAREAASLRPQKRPREAAASVFSSAEEAYAPETLDWLFDQIDESFQQMLLRKIDESGMTDAQCYKKANVDRKLFSKIRKDVLYRPSKATAIAFAVALELSLPETEDLLNKAGFALSRSSRFDLIIRYFIEQRRYDIFEINEVLFAYDQSLLGG